MNSKETANKPAARPWRAFSIFVLVIAVALVAHAIGSSNQIEFVYGGL